MNTINRNSAHKELVSFHRTMRWVTDGGSLSIRKTAGRYVVRLEDFVYGKTTITTFATLKGALVAAESLKEFYL